MVKFNWNRKKKWLVYVARIKGEKRKEIVILNAKIGPWIFFTWNQEAALKFHLKIALSRVIVFFL